MAKWNSIPFPVAVGPSSSRNRGFLFPIEQILEHGDLRRTAQQCPLGVIEVDTSWFNKCKSRQIYVSFYLAPQSQLVQLAAFVKARQIGVDEEQGDPMGRLQEEVNGEALKNKNTNSRSLRTVTSLCSKSKCSLEWFDWKWVGKSSPHLHVKLCPCHHDTTVGQPPVLQIIHGSTSGSGSHPLVM